MYILLKCTVKPRTIVGATFLKFLSENESAFDLLYCIAFKLMDQQWLSMRASYMEFNVSNSRYKALTLVWSFTYIHAMLMLCLGIYWMT
jgi:hypothetical protein